MPTYEYECSECGYILEAFHSMSANPLIDCPNCSKPKLIKLIGAGAAAIVRGSKTPCTGEKNRTKTCKCNKKPFWRDGPINKNILKNPTKYLNTGEI